MIVPRLLLVLALLGINVIAHAEVVVTFFANDFILSIPVPTIDPSPGPLPDSIRGAAFPGHAFIRVQGTTVIDGKQVVVDQEYGFFPSKNGGEYIFGESSSTLHPTPLLKNGTRAPNRAYVSMTISDAQYGELMQKIATWSVPSKGYNLLSQNCKDFTRDVAGLVGLKQPNGSFIQPAAYMRALMEANPERVRTSAHPDRQMTKEEMDRALQLFDYQSSATELRRTSVAAALEGAHEISEYKVAFSQRSEALGKQRDVAFAKHEQLLASTRKLNAQRSGNAINYAQASVANEAAAEADLRSGISPKASGITEITDVNGGSNSGGCMFCIENYTEAPRLSLGKRRLIGSAASLHAEGSGGTSHKSIPHASQLASRRLELSLPNEPSVSGRALVLWTGRRLLGTSQHIDLVFKADLAADYVLEAGPGVSINFPPSSLVPHNLLRLAEKLPVRAGIKIELPKSEAEVKESGARWIRVYHNGTIVTTVALFTDLYDRSEVSFSTGTPWLASGYGKQWNQNKYALCTSPTIGPFRLVKFTGRTVGAGYNPRTRDCSAGLSKPDWHDGGWSKCGIESAEGSACYRFSVQGHSPKKYTGQGGDTYLMVTASIDAEYALEAGQVQWLASSTAE